MEVKLYSDPACQKFAKKHPEEFDSFGCGPGGVGDYLVPDRILGLNVKPACQIHDWGYRLAPDSSEVGRERHDRILKNNWLRIINAHGGWLAPARRRLAIYGYNAVRKYGSPAYWEERNKSHELMEVSL